MGNTRSCTQFHLTTENDLETGGCVLFSQARLPDADNRLGSVGHLQLGEDVGDVVAYSLGTEGELPGDLCCSLRV